MSTITQPDLLAIQKIVAPLVGLQVTFIARGKGLVMKLSSPTEEDDEWDLIVYQCAWCIQSSHEVLIGSEDDRDNAARFQILASKTVQAIHISYPSLDSTICFSDDIQLRLFPIYLDTYYHWKVYDPEHNALTIGPGNQWCYET